MPQSSMGDLPQRQKEIRQLGETSIELGRASIAVDFGMSQHETIITRSEQGARGSV